VSSDENVNKLLSGGLPSTRHMTLADVAKHADVSAMTVSKVLRGVGTISKETSARVKASADVLGYVTDGVAGALSARKGTTVGIVIPTIADSVYSEIISALSDGLSAQGLTLLISESNFDPDTEERQIRMILSMRPAALIVSGGIQRTLSATSLLQRYPAPIVQIWDADHPLGTSSIGPSHEEVGIMAAEHFLKTGRRNLAYIGTELAKDICAHRRMEAFRDRLLQEKIEIKCILAEDLPRQAGTGEMLVEQMIASGFRPGGIFFLNDAMALGGLRALLDHDVQVPEAVSVLGFNGTSRLHTVRTRLTTISLDRREIGTAAAIAIKAMLNGQIPEPNAPSVLTLLPGTTG
jgi:LacI family gluconate utilization system Gnt-I transcriptional repressor